MIFTFKKVNEVLWNSQCRSQAQIICEGWVRKGIWSKTRDMRFGKPVKHADGKTRQTCGLDDLLRLQQAEGQQQQHGFLT